MSSALRWTGERLVPSLLNETAVEHLARYAFCQPLIKGRIVLDIACGEGYGSHLLSREAAEVKGVDIDKDTVLHAAENYKASNLSFIQANASKLPFEDFYFDVIVSFETIEHLEDQQQMLTEIKRVLKKNGLFIISTPNKTFHHQQENFDNPFHVKELDRQEFSSLLQKHFINIRFLNQQNLHGSLIYPEDLSFNGIEEATGSFQQIHQAGSLAAPRYFIAMASDGELPASNNLFFGAADIYEERFIALKNTWTYRVGAFFLSPFKWIKNIISNK